MAFYKVKTFARFARRNGIDDTDLAAAAMRVLAGQADADLGGGLFKVRVAKPGTGKSGGFRTLIAHKTSDHCFFVHGFEKSALSNINSKEEKALKELAKTLGSLSDELVETAALSGEFVLVEVEDDDEEEDEV